MKLVGLIGGMSWESTVEYYRIMNQLVAERLGGLHSARLLIHSVDFAPMEELQARGDWDPAARELGDVASSLAGAGAEAVLLCTNTMHVVASQVEAAAGVPLIHIADTTGRAVGAAGLDSIGLLGTRFTMEKDFYRERLAERYDLDVLIPDEGDRELVHSVIYDELCRGQVREESRRAYVEVIERLVERGAGGIILGCTEISLLVGQEDVAVP